MASWNDQEPYDGEVIIESMKIGDLFYEVERSLSGFGGYRITGGNLFGSQSIHFKTAQHVLFALGQISKQGSKPRLTQKEIEQWPGFLRVEERKKDEQA
jgi:hypothetical protein